MSNDEPAHVQVGGAITEVGLAEGNRVCILTRTHTGAGSVQYFDLERNSLGRLELEVPPKFPRAVPSRTMRIATDGTVWLGEADTLTQVGPDCRIVKTLSVQLAKGEEIGTFLLVPERVCSRHASAKVQEDVVPHHAA